MPRVSPGQEIARRASGNFDPWRPSSRNGTQRCWPTGPRAPSTRRLRRQWDPFLAATGDIDTDSTAAEAAFDRLRTAHQAKQDALDSLWLAWRNRPDPASDEASDEAI